MNWFKSFFSILLISVTLSSQGQAVASYDVLIVGGGASGVSAALQAARLGSKVLVVEETSWLGGMLTA
ncbi:FAD-dependent oxidoreductase, partial [Sphingobacterium siyangense]